ncbi:unnamed protein product [Lactuca virosa]|uniref:Transcriptional factor DELLA N-terminal domain-containing protein n=1 Tax=Lactuca virosa TaxID=75947 RepID=A0AAU9M2W9_9ASTR|nr:unnamed protein product [Lactuca virosa]
MKPNHPQKTIIFCPNSTSTSTSIRGDTSSATTGPAFNNFTSDIEHLEGVLGNDDGLSQIASDSVHYNPSDLSSWLQSMICELNRTTGPPMADDSFMNASSASVRAVAPSSGLTSVFVDDMQAIPGNAIYPLKKKAKHSPSSSSGAISASSSYNLKPKPNSNSVVPIYIF